MIIGIPIKTFGNRAAHFFVFAGIDSRGDRTTRLLSALMPNIDLSDDEHAAVTAAVRRTIDEVGSPIHLASCRSERRLQSLTRRRCASQSSRDRHCRPDLASAAGREGAAVKGEDIGSSTVTWSQYHC